MNESRDDSVRCPPGVELTPVIEYQTVVALLRIATALETIAARDSGHASKRFDRVRMGEHVFIDKGHAE